MFSTKNMFVVGCKFYTYHRCTSRNSSFSIKPRWGRFLWEVCCWRDALCGPHWKPNWNQMLCSPSVLLQPSGSVNPEHLERFMVAFFFLGDRDRVALGERRQDSPVVEMFSASVGRYNCIRCQTIATKNFLDFDQQRLPAIWSFKSKRSFHDMVQWY